MSKTITKISIVEDRDAILNFLRGMFEEADDFLCLQTYKNAEEAIVFLPKSDADIVIVDIKLPGQSGIECVRQVKELRPDIHFMMYTIFEEDDKIFESLKAGASGYLLKSPEEAVVLSAVRDLVNGGSPMSPAIARRITESFYNGSDKQLEKMELLSKRQNEILHLLADGATYRIIAEQLEITTGTVKQHIHKIYQKLHVQNKTEAINKYLGRS